MCQNIIYIITGPEDYYYISRHKLPWFGTGRERVLSGRAVGRAGLSCSRKVKRKNIAISVTGRGGLWRCILVTGRGGLWNCIPVTGRRGLWSCETLRSPNCLDNRLTVCGDVSLTHRSRSTVQNFFLFAVVFSVRSSVSPRTDCGQKP
jgi:hypothetical protein